MYDEQSTRNYCQSLGKYLIASDYIKMSNQSRKRYLECFTEEKMIKEVEDVYNGKSTQ